ncbi:NAD(P)-binding protein [Annulohypoxylon truncatum]|uniref:NAD(P)-binding protein n=1 Tax=Annulohypoxylon truncatum TaxID=327061 RepID=UPI0020086EDD|nr:NAD(P)-binding protein [Annulohypoxylon truncatum]KAI1213258.1 NAD(P)-binding protein [Annulohypoxylon truncatum]
MPATISPTTVLISGANRGLGKELLARYLARPNHVAVAANRNPEHATSKALAELPKGQGSRLVVVKLDASIEADAAKAVKQLIAQGVDHLDVVIANAGVSYAWPKVADLKTEDLQGHLIPDLFGVIWLYQAAFPLLKKSMDPKWITIGSVAGKLENPTPSPLPSAPELTKYRDQPPIPNAAYATSKAAVHWVTKRINQEEDWITAFVVHPGWVETDMGQAVMHGLGLAGKNVKLPIITVDESCDGIVHLIDVATRESHGGRFWDYDGARESW